MRVIGSAVVMARRVWAEPEAAGESLDDPATTERHREVIASKRFLTRIYDEWYSLIRESLPPTPGRVLEIGSGGGFFADSFAAVIRSDVQLIADVDVVLDAGRLPVADGALRAIVMTNVLHHVPDPEAFLAEAERCLRPGGVIAMIEPWVDTWSRWVYGTLHHEPFDPAATDWRLPTGGPLSAANGALPWMVFERDRHVLRARFPMLEVVRIDRLMPLRYLLSGGVSVRAIVPSWTFAFWRAVDNRLVALVPSSAMFARIVVRRRPVQA